MKVSKFALDKGKYVVVASYTDINETTKAADEHTLRTFEGPRPKLRDAMATLAYQVREFYKLTEHQLKIPVIAFGEGRDGRTVTIWLESVNELQRLPVGPLKLRRELDKLPSTDDRDPDSIKNLVLDAVDLAENKIIEAEFRQALTGNDIR